MVDADELDGVVDMVDEVFDCSRPVAGEFSLISASFCCNSRAGRLEALLAWPGHGRVDSTY